jgi:transposase
VPKKYIVTLTGEERAALEDLIRKGTAAARKLSHARVLLKADVGPGGAGWQDQQISTALDLSESTVRRVRQLFVEEGLAAALDPRPSRRPRVCKLDGAGEAHLIALACSQAPAGRERWTLRLLAERFVALGQVESICHETVRQVLKKVSCSPG